MTHYPQYAVMDDETVTNLILDLIEYHVVLVAILDKKIVGVIGLEIGPFRFNKHVKAAVEVIMWLNEDAQGQGFGKKMLKFIEPACKQKEANLIIMVHLANSPPQAAGIYERLGYTLGELCYTKVI
jgi:GNAT superfamily N-acetyltransferase